LLADGPLPPGRAVKIVEQVASALDTAHRVGLVHRDVKPSNILITDRDFAHLIDFGIARTADETALTNTGATVGTFAYMAPERFSSGDIDTRSDVYALACVLFEALTGPPPQPSRRNPTVPRTLDRVIATGMAKVPAQRYSTTTELAHAAEQAIAESTHPTRAAAPLPYSTPPPMPPPLRHSTPPPTPAPRQARPPESPDRPPGRRGGNGRASSSRRSSRASSSSLRRHLCCWVFVATKTARVRRGLARQHKGRRHHRGRPAHRVDRSGTSNGYSSALARSIPSWVRPG
jgi:serine/threonine protein kinase